MFKISRNTSLFTILISVICLFFSCKDNFDVTTELNGSRSDIMSMLQSADITQRASIDSDDFTFISSMGTIVIAEANSFVYADSEILAQGMIDFEMKELFTKSAIMQYGIATESDNSILESDGEFLFSASQNDQPLKLANDKTLSLTVPNSNPNPGMELFVISEGTWRPSLSPLDISESNNQASFSGYTFSTNRLDWVNIDYFTKFDLGLTDISISLPIGYEETKMTSWIVFRDLDIVLSSSGENLPIGEVVSIVCIASVDESNFRIDIQEVTIEEGLKVNLSPKEESAETIKKLLKQLD